MSRVQVGDQTQTVRSARFISDAGLWLILPRGFHFHGGAPLHQRQRLSGVCILVKWHRGQSMAGNLTSIHRCEMSLPIPGTHVTYRSRSTRACRGSVTLPSETFPERSPPIRACPGTHQKVRRSATARRSTYSSLTLGRKSTELMSDRRLTSSPQHVSSHLLTTDRYCPQRPSFQSQYFS